MLSSAMSERLNRPKLPPNEANQRNGVSLVRFPAKPIIAELLRLSTHLRAWKISFFSFGLPCGGKIGRSRKMRGSRGAKSGLDHISGR